MLTRNVCLGDSTTPAPGKLSQIPWDIFSGLNFWGVAHHQVVASIYTFHSFGSQIIKSTMHYLLPTGFHLQNFPFILKYLGPAFWHTSLPERRADRGEPNHHFFSYTFFGLHALPLYKLQIIYSGFSLDSRQWISFSRTTPVLQVIARPNVQKSSFSFIQLGWFDSSWTVCFTFA